MSTGNTMTPTDILAMSDDDFFKMGVPPEVQAHAAEHGQVVTAPEAPAAAAPAKEEDEDEALVEGETPPVVEGEAAAAPAAAADPIVSKVNPLELTDAEILAGAAPPKPGTEAVAAAPAADPAAAVSPAGSSEAAPAAADPVADPAKAGEAAPAAAAASETPPNYEELYKKIMAPFKANGKTIDLRDADEVISLMQMGANFTRKMQEIAPHRKVLTMLQNNGLLDEGQLSFLIDLSKKDPAAIKKLVKDAGLDPMDIDTSVDPAYREGNHRVSDAEVNFRSTLEELSSNPAGRETVQAINDWDQASKEALWGEPEIMQVIHSQRENGIYGRITEEIDRQRTLGTLKPNTPFLHAYKLVGDQLQAAGRFADVGGAPAPAPAAPAAAPVTPPAAPAAPQVVTTRVAAPKPQVANSEQASAASQSRSTSRKAAETVNPLAMSDKDFETAFSKFQNRV